MDSSTIDLLLARAEISELIFRFCRALDSQDWALLRSCFTGELLIDYVDFRQQKARISADEFVEQRRQGLQGLKTQHVSSNHEITIDSEEATCESSSLIYRFDPQMETNNSFDTHCQYEHTLIRTDEGWKVNSIVQRVLWSAGNPEVHGFYRQKRGEN
jgi:SnoaL-like domain